MASVQWQRDGRLKTGLLSVAWWFAGFITITGLGYFVFRALTAWAGLVQLAYVIPLVVAADRRGSVAFGVGVLCGAAAVLAFWVLAGAYVLVLSDV